VTQVVMEATSDNWKPPFYLLEAHGFQTWLVNAKNVKHLPGRPKTDRLDAVGLCKVAERQMLRPNFVPPVPIRRLRDLTRYRALRPGHHQRPTAARPEGHHERGRAALHPSPAPRRLLAKAARGELAVHLPTGLVYDALPNVVLDPDTGLRDATAHLFNTFEATGSGHRNSQSLRRRIATLPRPAPGRATHR
jgi:transposase